jgi:hypothetical protein
MSFDAAVYFWSGRFWPEAVISPKEKMPGWNPKQPSGRIINVQPDVSG